MDKSEIVPSQRRTVIIISNDKIGGLAYRVVCCKFDPIIYIDKSTSTKRFLKLCRKGRIPLNLMVKMLISELLRSGKRPPRKLNGIKNNDDLKTVLESVKPLKLILFRAGLIVNKNLINLGYKILNIHCSSLPDYGGLGTIQKALNDKSYKQEATLHTVTQGIDRGEIINTEPYCLEPKKSYLWNEDTAYKAGIRLLEKTLGMIK